MATRTLEQIMYELNPTYEAQAQVYKNQIADIPNQQASAQKVAQDQYNTSLSNLERQRDDYNYSANTSAATRGLGWSNVGQNYAAGYSKNSFTPAVSSLNNDLASTNQSIAQNYSDRQATLEQALAALEMDRAKTAQSIWQSEQDRAAAAAAKSASNFDLSKYFPTVDNTATSQKYDVRANGNDYQFYNTASNAPVKLGTYLNQYGGDFNSQAVSYLSSMANAGATDAMRVLAYLNSAQGPQKRSLAWNGGGGTNYYSGSTTTGNSNLDAALNRLGLRLS